MEWCGEGGTHFLVELALRTTLTTSLREGDAAAVGGHHAEVGHSQPVVRGGSSTAVELEGRGQEGGDKLHTIMILMALPFITHTNSTGSYNHHCHTKGIEAHIHGLCSLVAHS